jgi:hypothetical protein
MAEDNFRDMLHPDQQEAWWSISKTPSAEPGFRPCPAPDCQGYDLVDDPDAGSSTCFVCSHSWCHNCQVDMMNSQHADTTCAQYQQWKRDNDTGDETMEEILRGGLTDQNGGDRMRRCPNCRYPWMKDEQCSHVTCEPLGGGCGVHFCFTCAAFHGDSGDAIYQHQANCRGYVPPNATA